MTVNFKREEFACKCGCEASTVSRAILVILQMIRDTYGVPVTITSAVRCVEHNLAVGGAENSQHVPDRYGRGHAVDIKVKGVSPKDVYTYLDDMFPNSLGLGLYDGWVHIDDRFDRAYRWDKSSK